MFFILKLFLLSVFSVLCVNMHSFVSCLNPFFTFLIFLLFFLPIVWSVSAYKSCYMWVIIFVITWVCLLSWDFLLWFKMFWSFTLHSLSIWYHFDMFCFFFQDGRQAYMPLQYCWLVIIHPLVHLKCLWNSQFFPVFHFSLAS